MWGQKVASDDTELAPLNPNEGQKKSFFQRWKFLVVVSVFAMTMFLCGAFFVMNGVSSMLISKEDEIIVEGLRALEENDLDTASNRFIAVLRKEPEDTVAADYMAWIEARRGNFDRALEYARTSIAVPGHYSSFELMGYLALLGKGKAIGAPATIYYFTELLKQFPKEERIPRMQQMLQRSLQLAQTRQDYVDLVNEAARFKLPRGLLARGDLYFKGNGGILSPKSAIMFWNDALKAGEYSAINRLAISKWYGYGIKRDLDQAIELFKEAISKGDAVAAYNLGLIYLRTDDPQLQYDGQGLLEKSASWNYGPAITAGALLKLNQRRDARALELAYKSFEEATLHGDISGSILYAFMTFAGIGCPRAQADKARAIFYELKRRHINAVNGIYDYLTFAAINDDPEYFEAFKQIVSLCVSELKQEISFDDGDPSGTVYAQRNLNPQLTSYYKPICSDINVDAVMQKKLAKNYICRISDPYSLKIHGRLLYSPDFSKILTHYNPTSAIDNFVPNMVSKITLPAPGLPERFMRYKIDFVRINAWAQVPGYEPWYIRI